MPLLYVIRVALVPPEDDDDNPAYGNEDSKYIFIDMEMIARAPILSDEADTSNEDTSDLEANGPFVPCAQVLKGKDTTATDQELCNLQRLVEVTQANLLQQAIGNSPALPREQTQPPTTDQLTQQTHAAPRVQPNALLRVQPNEQNTKRRTTRSTATQQPSITDVHPPCIARWRGRRNNTLMLQETKKDSDHL
jgi:hypothetical protein